MTAMFIRKEIYCNRIKVGRNGRGEERRQEMGVRTQNAGPYISRLLPSELRKLREYMWFSNLND
jgi:hypothetical protein